MTDKEEIAAAARYMDNWKPDWWQNIDPLRLNLQKDCDCICGQNDLDWNIPRYAGFSGCFSARSNEPLWLEEIARRMPAPVREPVMV